MVCERQPLQCAAGEERGQVADQAEGSARPVRVRGDGGGAGGEGEGGWGSLSSVCLRLLLRLRLLPLLLRVLVVRLRVGVQLGGGVRFGAVTSPLLLGG